MDSPTPSPKAPAPLDLEAITKRCEAATPGPWKVFSGNPLSRGIVAVIEHSPDRFLAVAEDHFGGPWCAPATWEANARLIAAARTDIPLLVERVRELEAENERLMRAATCLTCAKDAVFCEECNR